jgi:hypothetical protein
VKGKALTEGLSKVGDQLRAWFGES